MLGTVKFYNDEKGFGFITPEDGSADVFFHVTQVVEGYDPQDGDNVTFEIANGRDGRPAAANVAPAGEGSNDQQEEYSEE
jgi:CspA family cold shock protein